MENEVNQAPVSPEVSVQNTRPRFERIARIVYLIAAAFCVYALIFSPKVRASGSASVSKSAISINK
jgi:hypothetical protein